MKKLILSCFFVLIFFSSCSDDVSNPVINPYEQQLIEFNNASGFNAVFVSDAAIVDSAKNFQGHGEYPGVDDWFAVEIDMGRVVLGGLPGQSAFYSILQTYYLSGGIKEAYWKMLQVKPHPVFGYRSLLGCFQINYRIHVAISKTLANPQYGAGGGWQLYIPDYSTSLTKFAEITLDTLSH